MNKSLKIFFQACDGIGHMNACIGLAQELAKRGHRICFLNNDNFIGYFKKYGFEEIILKDQNIDSNNQDDIKNNKSHPIESVPVTQSFVISGFLQTKSSYDQLDFYDRHKNGENFYCKLIYEDFKKYHSHLNDILKNERPDLIIIDNSIVPPCILFGEIPWAHLWSCNPLQLFNSNDLPPMMSGYPTYNRDGWEEFSKKLHETCLEGIFYYQNLLNNDFGYPTLSPEELYQKFQLEIYGYPEELDYTDIVPMPPNCIRIDSFCRSEIEDQSFELPEKFKNSNKKLIYVSLGSFGSSNVDLMRKIIKSLSRTPYNCIVSKGQFHEQLELSDNMYGEPFLPQPNILPLVDMVITHGGNNTITEAFSFGKPMLVMPLLCDQYDNAQRVQEKGYGYRIDPHDFTEDQLIELVDKILNDDEMIEKCRKAFERIQKSNARQIACEKIEQFVFDHQMNCPK